MRLCCAAGLRGRGVDLSIGRGVRNIAEIAVPLLVYETYTLHIWSLIVVIVKISEQMHEDLRLASNALSRSINAQAEHWMRIGMLAELHPELDHSAICRLLIRAEQAGGLHLGQLSALAAAASGARVKTAVEAGQ